LGKQIYLCTSQHHPQSTSIHFLPSKQASVHYVIHFPTVPIDSEFGLNSSIPHIKNKHKYSENGCIHTLTLKKRF
jgi:hypothetical protein